MVTTFRASTIDTPDVVKERQLSRLAMLSNILLPKTFLFSQRYEAESLKLASIGLRAKKKPDAKIAAAIIYKYLIMNK